MEYPAIKLAFVPIINNFAIFNLIMEINTQVFLELLKPVLRQASDEVLKIYRDKSVDVVEKADQSPLTMADLTSHEIITRALTLLTPDIPIISEESKENSDVQDVSRYWVVDPLDGTKEFIAGNGEFTINVALVSQHRPILGLVMAPVLGDLYFADLGHGAYVQQVDGDIQPISAAEFKADGEGLTVLCSRSHMDPVTEQYVQQMKNPEIIKKGGSMKFMDIASGRAHVYPRFGPTMEWDTCAPQIIVEESGGMLIDQVTQRPLEYGKPKFLNHHFIVFGKRV